MNRNRSKRFYSDLYLFVDEVNSFSSPIEDIREKVKDLSSVVEAVCRRADSSARVVLTGSMRPNRFTAFFDPKDTRGTFPPDVDMYVVSDYRPHIEQVRQRIADISSNAPLADAQVSLRDGFSDVVARYFSFPLDIRFIGRDDVSSQVPLMVAQKSLPLSDKTIRHIRALSALLKRNGLYGGYNEAIGGLATEMLVDSTGSFYNALEFLAQPASQRRPLPHPVTGRNLLANLGSDIERRLAPLMKEILASRKVWPEPFSFYYWDWIHKNNYRFGLDIAALPGCNGKSPRDFFSSARTFLMRTCASKSWDISRSSHYVVPYSKGHEIYFSYNDYEHLVPDTTSIPSGTIRRATSYVGVNGGVRLIDPVEGEIARALKLEVGCHMDELIKTLVCRT